MIPVSGIFMIRHEPKHETTPLEKRELKAKPRTKPVTSGRKSQDKPGTSLFYKPFVKRKIYNRHIQKSLFVKYEAKSTKMDKTDVLHLRSTGNDVSVPQFSPFFYFFPFFSSPSRTFFIEGVLES